jgi:hypothetical protein
MVANARAFAAALAGLDPPAAADVSIRIHSGLDHGVVSDPDAADAAFEFLVGP